MCVTTRTTQAIFNLTPLNNLVIFSTTSRASASSRIVTLASRQSIENIGNLKNSAGQSLTLRLGGKKNNKKKKSSNGYKCTCVSVYIRTTHLFLISLMDEPKSTKRTCFPSLLMMPRLHKKLWKITIAMSGTKKKFIFYN